MKPIIELNIYTDGSSLNKPRTGGIGVRFLISREGEEDEIKDIPFVGFKHATNNQMELIACISALKEVVKDPSYYSLREITVHSDSNYIIDGDKYSPYWKKDKWFLKNGQPVLNAELWDEYLRIKGKIRKRIKFRKVKAHSDDQHNIAVDKMAKKSAKLPLHEPMSAIELRRKGSSKSTRIGSIGKQGQRLSIRIVTSEYLKAQRLVKYRCEVISKGSKYYGNIDFLYSKELLKAGHRYVITLSKNAKKPFITAVRFNH